MDTLTKPENKTEFDNHIVYYDDDALNGVKFLRDRLDFEETKPLFYYARTNGSAEFEDSFGGNYTLTYDRSELTWTVVKRS